MGRQENDPTNSTASNFLYATPLAMMVSMVESDDAFVTWEGGLLAIASGAVASGIGYAIWYRALKNLRATSASVVQLSVPALATLGGVVFLAEPPSLRITVATALTLGGIAIVLKQPTKPGRG